MLGLIVVAMWVAFVCSFLIWQQLTGDLSGSGVQDTVMRCQPSATQTRCSAISAAFMALAPMEERLVRLARMEDGDRRAGDLVSMAER